MNKFLKLSLVAMAMATATMVSTAPVFARGGAASIMNSPGYQRRLQESRQQVSQPDAQPATAHRRHKSRHHHRN